MATILITGTSTGLGYASAQVLVRAGHRVFATMREPEGRNAPRAQALRESLAAVEGQGSVEVLDLDVTEMRSIEAAVAAIIADSGALDVVVNNAGIGGASHCESFTAEQFRQIYEVNVFGVQRVMRAVLPHMRAREQGLFIQISSGIGRIVMPFMGPYVSSKFALEALSEGYRYELEGTGVEVTILEPGAFKTNFLPNMLAPADPDRIASYGELASAAQQTFAGMEALLDKLPPASIVGEAIAELVGRPAGERPLRVVVDPYAGGPIEQLNVHTVEARQALFAAMAGGEEAG